MDVLRYLCRHPHAVIPAEELLEKCWGSARTGRQPGAQGDRPVAQGARRFQHGAALYRNGAQARLPGHCRGGGRRNPRADAWDGGSPFRGLAAFEESHAAIFFGRVQAATRLRQTVLDQAERRLRDGARAGRFRLRQDIAGARRPAAAADGTERRPGGPRLRAAHGLRGPGRQRPARRAGRRAARCRARWRAAARRLQDAVSLGRRLRDEPAAVAAVLCVDRPGAAGRVRRPAGSGVPVCRRYRWGARRVHAGAGAPGAGPTC
jgi:hypothetical protein